ncbi:MarR family winged helix-turn-helix transcriptional regulator [Microbacterium sp. NPDC091662]|uniref:MarR family winged helix-turn-helix transcriptional regulator n=1 Tax=Microbacterium sp. NPDC091662 TaxID=3364211 RepID=UPI003830B84F
MSASSDAPADDAADDSSEIPGETRASGSATDLLGDAELDQAVTRVEQELGRLFARIRIGWREAAATVHPDLQPLGYQVLTSIATGKATSAGAIIERLQTDKSAVSRQVRQLEQLGLVESVPDPEDRRARVLVATELAQERVALARSRYEGRIGERLRNWTAADLDHFADLLAGLGG